MNEIQTILHPTDFSESASHAQRLARSLARDHEARLVLLHVIPAPYPVISGLPVGGVIPAEEPGIRNINEFRNKVETDHPNAEGLTIDYRVVEGDPVDAILSVADDEDAALIVMGSHGRTGLERVLMGSVAEKVVRKAPCSVLTVKTPTSKPFGKPVKKTRDRVASV